MSRGSRSGAPLRAMGGCESCASGRRKEVQRLIDDAKRNAQRFPQRRHLITSNYIYLYHYILYCYMIVGHVLYYILLIGYVLTSFFNKREEIIYYIVRHQGDSHSLREAIQRAEAEGLEVLSARKAYAELAKQERQSPERSQEMLRWAMSTQDGVILRQVIEEVQVQCPESLALVPARSRLKEFQEELKRRLSRCQDVM